jgi:SAM-dependent methyltransferase
MLRDTQAFFAERAATWDERFPGDEAAFAQAIAELNPPAGGVVVDLGCGTGRALPHFTSARIALGLDVTQAMLTVAHDKQRGLLTRADATCLPLRDQSVDAFLAAGLLTHVPDAHTLLVELARAGTPTARLAVFHPIGRAALARRHGRELRPDELLDPSVLPGVLAAAGWRTERIDDSDNRYLALAAR